jgi:hypothetical protein
MKKKNLKALNLKRATISSLNIKTISGGTIAITDIVRTILTEETATGCSQFMKCDSVQACPAGVAKTKFVNTDTKPASLCTEDR